MAARFDVAVVGAGGAGVAAAVGAAQAGARTQLLERGPSLGGAATLRGVATYCGLFTCRPAPRRAVGGVADAVLARLRRYGGVSDPVTTGTRAGGNPNVIVTVDPEAVKVALDDVVTGAGVEVLLSTALDGAEHDGGRITELSARDFGGQRLRFTAEAYVDASGDASLTALAAGAVTPHTERRQTATLGVRFGNIPADADLSAATVGDAVRADMAAGQGPLTSSTGLVVCIPPAGDVVAYLADEDLDPLDARAYSTATRHARRQARAYLEVIRTLPGCRTPISSPQDQNWASASPGT